MPQETDNRKESVWHSIVVPTAIGLEAFFWRVAWFTLVVLFVYMCLFPHAVPARNDLSEGQASEAVGAEPRNPEMADVAVPAPRPGS